MRRLMLVVVVLAVSCGGGDSPTSPSQPIPTVSGTYTGSVNFTFPELQVTVTCPASTTVTQSGRTVNIAPLVLTGDCDSMSIPFGQTTIDATGAIEGGSARGSYNEPSCGVYNYVASGGFFGSEFRLSMTATSTTCYNFNFTAVLSR